MQYARKINDDTFWIGADDRRLNLFENIFPLPNGVSYNSYVVLDEKNVLLDTADMSVRTQFLENLNAALDGGTIDYLIINHMEPDHAAVIEELCELYPEMTLVGNSLAFTMLKQYFDIELEGRCLTVKEGDTLCTGEHTFSFIMAPMVHWPEAMVTFDSKTGALFSADAFGTFGALNGNIFNDEVNFDTELLDEARRYYSNIVGKYGQQVQALLSKASSLDIKMICPLHGPIWRSDLDYIIAKYDLWSKYQPEENSVVIAYASMYGHTASVADALAFELSQKGIRNVKVYDVSKTNISFIISEIFRSGTLVLASPTYNMGIYPIMETLVHDMKALNVQNRKIALIENGTWAPAAAKKIKQITDELADITYIDPVITIKSALKDEQKSVLGELADNIANSLNS